MWKLTTITFAIISMIQNGPVESLRCRSTWISGDLSNRTAREKVFSEAIVEFWRSSAVPSLSQNGDQFVDEVLANLDTDSMRLLEAFFYFTLYFTVYTSAGIEYNKGLCLAAINVNGSVSWVQDTDGRGVLNLINIVSNTSLNWCLPIAIASLEENGCKKLPELNFRDNNCYERGLVYKIEEALELFGSALPYRLHDMVQGLYASEEYSDKVLAACFMAGVTQVSNEAMGTYSPNFLVELLYWRIKPRDSKCCCKHRRERFLSVCQILRSTSFERMIRKYSNTECPPGAAFLK